MARPKENLTKMRHLECPICLIPYNTTTHKPKLVPCGHSLCLECLQVISDSQSLITCPIDRREHPIPGDSVDNFPNNFTTLDILANLCEDCGDQPKQRVCLEEHCSKALCDGCRENHRRHFYSELRSALTDLKQEAGKLHTLCDDDSDVAQLEDKVETAIAEVTKLCDELKQNLIEEIKTSKEKSIESLFKKKNSTAASTVKCRIQANKLLCQTRTVYKTDTPDNVLSDAYQQMIELKTELTQEQDSKPEVMEFNCKILKKGLDEFFLCLLQIILPLGIILTEDSDSKNKDSAVVSSPDYTRATLQNTYDKAGSAVGELHCPNGMCVSTVTNQIAVVEHSGHRIHLLTNSLRPVSVFGGEGEDNNQYKFPWDVTITDKGLMFITDFDNNRIQATDRIGVFLYAFGSEGEGQDEFQGPTGIASTQDHLYICDSENFRVKVTKHDGTYVREFGTSSTSPLQFISRPWFIAVSEIHNKAVVSDESGNIYIFNLTGQFITTIECEQPPVNIDARGLVIDQHGNLIVADHTEEQLMVFGEQNQVIATIDSGYQKGHGGMALTVSGDILVSDFDGDCVKLFNVPSVHDT